MENEKHPELHQYLLEIDDYISKGEILNPEFVRLTNKINRFVDKQYQQFKIQFRGQFQHYYDAGNVEITDILWSFVSSVNDIKNLSKKLDRVKKERDNEVFKKYSEFVAPFKSLIEKYEVLKKLVVKVTTKREQAKAEKQIVLQKQFRDSSTLIAVLNMHIEEYKKVAGEKAEEQYQRRKNVLEAHDWNLDSIATRPNGNMGRSEYQMNSAIRSSYLSLFERVHTSSPRMKDPVILKYSATLHKKFIDDSIKGAEASYHAWVAKMIQKIGKPVVDAKMTGNPWTRSVLTVTCNDGETQVWNNQMIINFSKYGLMFNQFPSRRAK